MIRAHRAALLPTLAMTLALAACAGVPAPSDRASADASPRAAPSATASETASDGLAAGEPGRPFDATGILAAMRDSRRPGGVPEALQTDAIASALADQVWTLDGKPWTSLTAGGSCGTDSCTLELSGGGADAAGEDVWVFAVDPADGSVRLASADLHAVPASFAASLDELARASDPDGLLDGLLATSVRWLPPPDDGRFVLAYRSGDEEGSCVRDATIDAARATVEIGTGSGC